MAKEIFNSDAEFKNQRTIDVNETMLLLKRDIMKFFSWGVSNIYKVNTKAVGLKVSGHHHKGLVFISVSGLDLYDVVLVNNNQTVKERIEGLYFDQLADVIDEKIEKIPEYIR